MKHTLEHPAKCLKEQTHMKSPHVNDLPEFAEAQHLLRDLENEKTRLDSELALCRVHLARGIPSEARSPSLGATDFAKVLLADDAPPKPSPVDDLRQRELAARERLVEVLRAIARIRDHLELVRERARFAQLRSDPRRAEIITAWSLAVDALRAACRAEDEFLDELVARGFGRNEPVITVAHWLRHREFQGS